MKTALSRSFAALSFCAVCGCSPAHTGVDTGARTVAESYYEGLLQQNWLHAYNALHPENRSRWTEAAFATRAKTYLQTLGFEPISVHIRACEEHGEEAIVHVVWIGRGGTRSGRFKDAIVLRHGAMGWGVLLPANFGLSLR